MKRDRNTNGLPVLFAVALLALGCTKHDGSDLPAEFTDPAPLQVNVGVAPQSRSVVTGTAFGNGSRINILLHDAGATNSYNGNSQPYEFRKTSDSDPGLWIPTQNQGLYVGDLANVYAHYPDVLPAGEAALSADKMNMEVALPASRDFGSINGSDFESFYLKLKATDTNPTEIFTCRSEMDLMTGVGTQVANLQNYSKATTITMKHALAMVIVYVKKSIDLQESPSLEGISIRNSGANTPLKQGSFALSDNSFTPNSTPASYTRTMSGFPIDVVRYAMLVYPATMAAGEAEMELRADQVSYIMPMPAKEWISGKVYIYNVEISGNEAQLVSLSLADWPEWIDKPFDLD